MFSLEKYYGICLQLVLLYMLQFHSCENILKHHNLKEISTMFFVLFNDIMQYLQILEYYLFLDTILRIPVVSLHICYSMVLLISVALLLLPQVNAEKQMIAKKEVLYLKPVKDCCLTYDILLANLTKHLLQKSQNHQQLLPDQQIRYTPIMMICLI